MRTLAGVLLIVAVPIAVVLGGLLLLSAQHQRVMAEIEANDLSAVASDLMSPGELAKQRAAGAKRKKNTRSGQRGSRQRVLAYGLFFTAVALLVAGVLALLGRRRTPTLVLSALGLVTFGAMLVAEPVSGMAAGGGVLAALGVAAVLLSKRDSWRGSAPRRP